MLVATPYRAYSDSKSALQVFHRARAPHAPMLARLDNSDTTVELESVSSRGEVRLRDTTDHGAHSRTHTPARITRELALAVDHLRAWPRGNPRSQPLMVIGALSAKFWPLADVLNSAHPD